MTVWGAASMCRALSSAGKCSCSYTTSAPVMTSGDWGRLLVGSPQAYGTTCRQRATLMLSFLLRKRQDQQLHTTSAPVMTSGV